MADPNTILDGVSGFEWDSGDADKLRERHGVLPAEAEQVLLRRPWVLAPDSTHSAAESRWYALGETAAGRRLMVVFTVRGQRVRVISARPMSRRERVIYGQTQDEADSGI